MNGGPSPPRPSNVPRATVRLQFNRDFGFAAATALVPYFAKLGISHIYASPFLQAREGSAHGYDIIDHGQFNREIGDAADFDRLVEALHAHGMGLILDFVPNHMGVGGSDNRWWLDVLEWGRGSPFAPFFDFDWDAHEGKVLLPILGEQYGAVLEAGDLKLRFDRDVGSFSVWYHTHRFPVAVRHYSRILRATSVARRPGPLAELAAAFGRIESGAGSVRRQETLRRDADQLRARLTALAAADTAIAQAIGRAVDSFNGRPGEPESFRQLHRLLEDQAYRIAYWRVAADEINYRRFFDINELAGLRMEQPDLFELAHQLIFRLILEGKLQGLRLDHVDGLYDPAGYCTRVQDRAAYLMLQAGAGNPPATEPLPPQLRQPIYLLVEKILARHEYLREDWPVAGTTGYDFMSLVNGLFVDPAAERALDESYARFLGRRPDYETMVTEAKRRIMRANLASELYVLASELHRLSAQSWRSRDYTMTGIRWALADVVAAFPVYRTYITPGRVTEDDRRYLSWAVAQARKSGETTDTTIYDFLAAALSTDLAAEEKRGYWPDDVYRIAMKFQQYTGPVMAKALEDTVFYRYFRLVSLNEVGGEPSRFSVSPAAFHHNNQERLRRLPHSLLATATHDHKRGEDTRVRIDAISELAGEWSRRVRRWARLNQSKRREVDGARAPSANDEYLLYQTLVGAWPFDLQAAADDGFAAFAERIAAYMVKAVREAKVRSSWASPNADYEDAVERFVRGVLDPARSGSFLADLMEFQQRIARIGAVNGLAQALLRLTAPGVPDLYQGSEFWDLSLVDPDNRRPVDYLPRTHGLDGDGLDAGTLSGLLDGWRDGRIKQHVIACALDVRRRDPELFATGDYQPLDAVGKDADRLVSYIRRNSGTLAVVVAPRLVAPLLGDADRPLPPAAAWGDTAILVPSAAVSGIAVGNGLLDALTGRTIVLERRPRPRGEAANGAAAAAQLRVREVLAEFPVALLTAGFGAPA